MNVVKVFKYRGQKINLLGDKQTGFILDSPFLEEVFQNAEQAEEGFREFVDSFHHPECHGRQCDCLINPKLLAHK